MNFGSKVFRLLKKHQPVTIKRLHTLYCKEYGSKMSYDSFRQSFWRLANRGLCRVVRREKAQIGFRHYYRIRVNDERVWEDVFRREVTPKKEVA